MSERIVALILKEWIAHKNNFDKSGEWFECNQTETNACCNYSVGVSITTCYADGREQIHILKTKEEAEDYSKKEKEKFGGCGICDRFKRLLSEAKKEVEK